MLSTHLYLYFAAILTGVLAPVWFGKLFIPVRKIRKGGEILSKASLELPGDNPLCVEEFADHKKNGDKIVIAHFLPTWTKDLQRKIQHNLMYGGFIIGAINVAIILDNDTKQATGNAPKTTIETIIANWPLPVFFLVAIIQVMIYFMLVHDQLDKHSKVIKKEKEKSIA